MNNSRGISLIALVITIIVIIIITSITTYTGINMISEARLKDANDKLKTMCNALRRDDEFLDENELEDVMLTKQNYSDLDLINFYDENYPVYLTKKQEITTVSNRYIYTLNMYKKNKMDEPYATETFQISEPLEKNNYTISFDEKNGVNRPLLYTGMFAVSNDGTQFVSDVYSDNWYNYNSSAPSFAKMKYDKNGDGMINASEQDVYIWIPRFAYYIQNYYNGVNDPLRPFVEVPSSAMKIVFLRENTNYMNNNEVIPAGYKVHPAFEGDGEELPGFWVAAKCSNIKATFSSAISTCENIAQDEGITSHLMTNSEFGAILYLMFAYDSYDEIDFKSENEFVAGVMIGSSESSKKYMDVYEKDTTSPTGLVEKTGDAMIETNWNRLRGDFISNNNNAIVRLMKSGYFDFTEASKSSQYYYREVIVGD